MEDHQLRKHLGIQNHALQPAITGVQGNASQGVMADSENPQGIGA